MPFPIRRRPQTLSLEQAALVGALHGPAELLPISSSGHLDAIPWLLRWDGREPEPGLRKSFDVALHAGATIAWLLVPRGGGREALRDLRPASARQWGFLALAVGLPAVAGLVFEETIERRLGTPTTVAAGLLGGSLLMLTADGRPQTREQGEAGGRDGLWLGIAQASALLPGVSRSGAALAAARFRGFGRLDSRRLAAQVGLPVIAGATILKGLRLLESPPAEHERATLAVGAAASFASTWLLAPALTRWPAGESLIPYVLYRTALALMILARMGPA